MTTPDNTDAGMTETTTGVDSSKADESRNFRKVREGLVVSDKMDKTVVVAVEDRVQHPLYKKTLRRTNKLKAHDEQNSCGVGDRVLLMETRPLSATKRWRVVEVLEKAK
jgi:small subunit ribosomal protein S17